MEKTLGMVSNIQRYSVHDGPGIRTVVFLKGCPLRCLWCSNPECLSPFPEVGFVQTRCKKCHDCIEVCPKGAITIGSNENEGYPVIDRNRCDNCGKCIANCYPKALIMFGQEMTSGEVLAEVMKDSLFYRRSGGGITISGGEPLQQPNFLIALLQLSQSNGISTAIETCGEADPLVFKAVLKYVDYLLFDIKCLDPAVHCKYTGRSNKLLLENLRVAAASGVNLLIRMPLIPGINDSEKNIEATTELVKKYGNNGEGIELMPYHRLGLVKYKSLGRVYPMGELPSVDVSHVEKIRKRFESLGVRCSVSW